MLNFKHAHKLIPDFVSAAHIRHLVRKATEDAFRAGRAMTLRGVECLT